MKKVERQRARLEIEHEVFDLELGQNDPPVWKYGTPLTRWEDLHPRMKAIRTVMGCSGYNPHDPYDYYPSGDDWQYFLDGRAWGDEYEYEYEGYEYNPYEDDYRYGDSLPYDPCDPVWVKLWVDGEVNTPYDVDDGFYRFDCDDDYDPYESWEDWAPEPEVAVVSISEARDDRARERARAGERYFKTFRRVA